MEDLNFDTLLWLAILFVAVCLVFRFYDAYKDHKHPRLTDEEQDLFKEEGEEEDEQSIF